MKDGFGRNIDYMRVSITDRCNLRCIYCMPDGIRALSHSDVLSYEEILRICGNAVKLGIVNFKVTGGEPLVRSGCVSFVSQLKRMSGVETVTLTTNGTLLAENLDALCDAGVDGVNISLDTLDDALCQRLTSGRCGTAEVAAQAVMKCAARGIRTKINAVLLADTFCGLAGLADIARDLPVDVRFIELMPIGEGAGIKGVAAGLALDRLRAFWPDLAPTGEMRGNGPAIYYSSQKLTGRIGFIGANSHKFCGSCNRVRLTSTGRLKPCLCFDTGSDLRSLMRLGASDGELLRVMRDCIGAKPAAHCFDAPESITEHQCMSKIGG